MADLATLGLAIDSRPAIDAANALDKMGEAAARGEGRVKQILTAADSLVAALNRNTAATAALTGRMDQMQMSGARAADAIKVVGVTASTAEATVTDLAQGLEKTGAAATTSSRALDAAATSAQKHVAVTSQAAAATVKATVAHNDNAKAAGLSANELRNLSFQLNDITTMALSGASAFQIMATQGGQIFQIAQSSTGGVKGLFEQAGNAATALVGRIGLVGAGLTGLAAGFATAAVAAASYRSQETDLVRSRFGVGEASGATLADLQRAAVEASAGGKVTRSQARGVIGELNAEGTINPAVYASAAEAVGLLVTRLGKEFPDAQAAVLAGLQPSIKGFDALNRQFLLGDASLREQMETLYQSGRAFEAQAIIVDRLNKKLQETPQSSNFLVRGLRAIANTSLFTGDPDAERIGAALGGRYGGRGDDQEALDAARARVAALQSQRALPNGLGGNTAELAAARVEVQRIETAIAQAAESGKAAKTTLTSLTVQPLIDSLNPAQKRINDLRATAEAIDTYLKTGGEQFDKDGVARRTMGDLRSQADLLAKDLERGGSQFANALREAQFNLRTVGFSPQGQRAAAINERAENEIRDLPLVLNPAYREQQAATIRERQRLETETLRQQTYNETSTGSGRYSIGIGQVPAQYRDAFYEAGTRYGVSADLLAAQARRESRFNPNAVSPAGAQGISQFMPETARGYGLTNPFDPLASIDAQGRLMRDLLRQFDGNEVAALVGYNAGPRTAQRFLDRGSDVSTLPRETQGYIREILTPPPNAQQMVQASTERARGLENEGRLLDINNQYLGVNGEKLDAATRLQALLDQAVAQNIEVTPQLRAEFERIAGAGAGAARALAGTQAGRTLEFERDQLGRDRFDQQAFARARSVYGDVTTPQALAYIDQSRETAYLAEARSTLTDASTGFVTALSRGANAAQAFGNALSRLGDRLISGAMDSLIGSLFARGAGGGGIGGLFSGLFGGVSGGGDFNMGAVLSDSQWFASGGVMTPFGRMPLQTYSGGGVASSPQMAIFGEGSMNEAYVPLPDGRRIPVAMSNPANANAAPTMTDARSYSFDLRGSTLTQAEVQSALAQAIAANNSERDRTMGQRYADWRQNN